MPPKKANQTASLADMIDSDGDLDMMPFTGSDQENEPAEKPKRGGRAAAKPRGTKARDTTVVGAKAKVIKAKANAKRAPLKEQQYARHTTDAEDADDFDDMETDPRLAEQASVETVQPQPAPKKRPGRKGRPPGKAKQAAAAMAAVDKVRAIKKDGEFEYTPTKAVQNQKTTTGKHISQVEDQEMAALESAPVAFEDEHTLLSVEEVETRAGPPAKPNGAAQSVSRQSAANAPAGRRRAGSASDTEQRGTDPAMRRKLGEMTRKLESMETKYRNLREIGVVEAESNYERLKKQSEQRTKAANDLIESLRAELEAQRSAAQEARSQNSDLSNAHKEAAKQKSALTGLEAAYASLQNENRALHAKLNASRAASQDNAKTTATSARGKAAVAKAAAGIGADVQVAQLKEDLYSDLTGLIVRGVDRQDDQDIYDCIQTGRNGTLHFKLSVAADKEGTSYEETEFSYEPRLDSDRDMDLIEILPEYLCEEITFSRNNAARFYSRIADTLTKRLVD